MCGRRSEPAPCSAAPLPACDAPLHEKPLPTLETPRQLPDLPDGCERQGGWFVPQEAELMWRLRHRNVVGLSGVSINGDQGYLLMVSWAASLCCMMQLRHTGQAWLAWQPPPASRSPPIAALDVLGLDALATGPEHSIALLN
jgi:hypothetical protein